MPGPALSSATSGTAEAGSPTSAGARRKRGHAVTGKVYLAGKPLVRARVRVTTKNGRKLRLVSHRNRTDKFGMFGVRVARFTKKPIVVQVRGGRLNGRKPQHGVALAAYGRLTEPIEYVNMGSTLLVRYHRLHPKQTTVRSMRRVSAYLRLPKVKSHRFYRLGMLTHVGSSIHQPGVWFRRAKKAGGTSKYLKRQAQRIKGKRVLRPALTPVHPNRYYLPGFGADSTLFTGKRRAAKAGRVSATGLISDVLGATKSLVTWGLGNAATSAACAAAHSGISQGILGCNATQGQAANIQNTLDQMTQQLADIQTQLNNVQVSLNKISTEQAAQNLATSMTDAGLTPLYAAAHNITATLQTLSNPQNAPVNTFAAPADGWPYSTVADSPAVWPEPTTNNSELDINGVQQVNTIEYVCAQAYVAPGQPEPTSSQSGFQACQTLGDDMYASSGGYADLVNTFFEYFAGGGGTDSPELLIPTAQTYLTTAGPFVNSGGDANGAGINQNGLNQMLAQLVLIQNTVMQGLIAWQSFYESWEVGAAQVCTTSTPVTIDPTSFVPSFINTCTMSQAWSGILAIEQYIATNGARASWPNVYQAESLASEQYSGTIADTVASPTDPPVYWTAPLDVSGISQGTNEWYPYVPWGPQPGQDTEFGYPALSSVNPVTSPTSAEAILNGYPEDKFQFAGSAQLAPMLNHAWGAYPGSQGSVNQVLGSAGFLAGAGNAGITWSTLATSIDLFSFAVRSQYPAPHNNPTLATQCPSNWPTAPGYSCSDEAIPDTPANQPPLDYMGITGTYGSSFYDTDAAGSAGLTQQACGIYEPKIFGPWGPYPTIGINVCINPTSDKSEVYYGLLFESDPPSTPWLWAGSMITGVWNQTSIPAFNPPQELPQATATEATNFSRNANQTYGYVLAGTASAAQVAPPSNPDITATVNCQVSSDSTFPAGSTTTIAALPSSVGVGAPVAVNCDVDLNPQTTYYWRVVATQQNANPSRDRVAVSPAMSLAVPPWAGEPVAPIVPLGK